MPPRPRRRSIRKGASIGPAPGTRASGPSKSSAPLSDNTDASRQPAHNPAADAIGIERAPQRAHTKSVMSSPRSPSEPKADFAGQRAPDDIAEGVPLHRTIEQIVAAVRNRHRAIGGIDARVVVDERARLR